MKVIHTDDNPDEHESLADEVHELPVNNLEDNKVMKIIQNEEDFCDLESLPLGL